MRSVLCLLSAVLVSALPLQAQQCTGLCLQQVACAGTATTSISGTVYAPNGMDPLPGILVYIPNAPVDALQPGVSCPKPGQALSGSPLVGTRTAPDGTFTLTNVPVGANIPIVIQSGRWRRQVTVPATAACTNTAFSTRMPRNQSEGDIPLIAINTGAEDEVECVLRRVGISDSEFTNPNSTGRIHLYLGNNAPGAEIDTNTPTEDALMKNPATLDQYDILMLPCNGSFSTPSQVSQANLVDYANAGGRVYISHDAMVWMTSNPGFAGVADWSYIFNMIGKNVLPHTALVDPTLPEYKTLTEWLTVVGVTDPTTPNLLLMDTPYYNVTGVGASAQPWISLDSIVYNHPIIQFTVNTPLSQKVNQCGRVLYADYHIATPPTSPIGVQFPKECGSYQGNTEEKLFEYSLFDLSNDGGPPTLTPASADFGTVPVGTTSAPQTFTWTNNSIFGDAVTSATTSGDFSVQSSNCSYVAPSASCQITVAFKPLTTGTKQGVLSVVSGGTTLTAQLTGSGGGAVTPTSGSLAFGNVDVGATAVQSFGFSNTSNVLVPTALSVTGEFRVASSCGSTLAAGASCNVDVTFAPVSAGQKTGTVSYANGQTLQLTGNSVDFAVSIAPESGSTIAGVAKAVGVTVLPLSGFAANVTMTCTTTAPASTCTPATSSFVPSATGKAEVSIVTTSQYSVVGYSSAGIWFPGLLSMTSAGLLCSWGRCRKPIRLGVTFLVASTACGCVLLAGCSGRLPSENATYTPPGTYTCTVTLSDGFLTHSATYTLNVTAR